MSNKPASFPLSRFPTTTLSARVVKRSHLCVFPFLEYPYPPP